MERFSAYRDPGTGIQPFLPPVSPLGSELLNNVTIPLQYALGAIRTLLVLLLVLLYIFTVEGICLLFLPIPLLHHFFTHLCTFIIGRVALFITGVFWISVEVVNRKRGRGAKLVESWSPRAGDIIVSNWVSWIEIVWLALRFNPVFVLPVVESNLGSTAPKKSATPISHVPGRRTGTGSANIQTQTKPLTPHIPIRGFRRVSLLGLVRSVGHVPTAFSHGSSPIETFEDIRQNAARPIVVFPECTTSNGRGLLCFANIFNYNIPVKDFLVFVMCVRYDPPTNFAPTVTLPIPSNIFNPVHHLFLLSKSLSPQTITIRLLAPSESPSSQLFVASEVLTGTEDEDKLGTSCAVLISQIGKIKRIGFGWEEKANFLEFYWERAR